MVLEWYKVRAKDKFAEIAEPLIQKFKKYNVEPKGLYIQNMSKRWGSCTPANNIILNVDAIKLPFSLIDYLIVHELVHTKIKNHSKEFWAEVAQHLPKWKTLDAEMYGMKL